MDIDSLIISFDSQKQDSLDFIYLKKDEFDFNESHPIHEPFDNGNNKFEKNGNKKLVEF